MVQDHFEVRSNIMDLGIKDKVALVTGTASQIGQGKAIALTLAREGCDIVGFDKEIEGAKQTADEIIKLGRRSIALKVDVANSAEVVVGVQQALKQFGKIDILINNAGEGGGGNVLTVNDERWNRGIDVNLKGAMTCMKAVLPDMISRKWGRVVSTSSAAGINGSPTASYSAAKAGLLGLTKSAAAEVGPSGITVNAIVPGMVLTNFTKGQPPERIVAYEARVPMRRVTKVEDVASLIAFLVSEQASYITGQTIFVDGGALMR
jgi:3-oxoacyl-[acyl-carrier protein] reductase